MLVLACMSSLTSTDRDPTRSPQSKLGRTSRSGFALVESTVAMALLGLMLGCMFAGNTHLLGLLRQGKQSTLATEMIQERVEQFRTSVWNDFTDPANLRFLADQTQARLTSTNLPGVSETIVIEPYPNPGNTRILCTRPVSGNATATGPVLTGEKSIKVTVTIEWKGAKRTRTRAVSTIMTNRGL